ncbi:hypothetical protein CLAIMM_11737 [Cladophialophora immunda]|nr:hypothetical protein CLAIMM_11737 [Cladophialophora immunda]
MTEPTTRIPEPAPPEAVNVIQSVLSVKHVALQDVLDYHGISLAATLAEADELEEDPGVAGAGPRSSEQSESELPQARSPGSQRNDSSGSEDLGTDTPPFSIHSLTANTASGNEELSYITDLSRSAASQPHHPQMNPFPSSSDDYPRLLRKVVNTARQITLPSRGAFDMSAIYAALLSVTSEEDVVWEPYRVRSTKQLERDKQVGAAGELFVFELLSHLNPSLPGFSRENWQSTIRSYVTSHPEYSTLHPWNGIETADITYADHDSTLTNLLIDKGYLASDTWAGARLQYYIEVKTTTGACETPFYMSKRQYKMMQMYTNSNANSRRTENIYVIFRVFNLGTDSIGLKVLVDPESVRQRGELTFTAATWSVVAKG